MFLNIFSNIEIVISEKKEATRAKHACTLLFVCDQQLIPIGIRLLYYINKQVDSEPNYDIANNFNSVDSAPSIYTWFMFHLL